MAQPPSFSIEDSHAFVERFVVEPTGDGPLNGLSFAVKDLIDVAGRVTGCGNPRWRETHPPASVHAVCVEQLLAAGARCVGKTVCDELAFSLTGENYFYGTPLNPKAPDRVPGGSSSGSASAVACSLADFALGTDTGGSVRVPASNCGLFGLRPSHGFISVAGVMPFAPGFDTVGVFARNAETLARASQVLLGAAESETESESAAPKNIYLVKETFEFADDANRTALAGPIEALRRTFNLPTQEISLGEICGDAWAADFNRWRDLFCVVQWSEIESCLGGWIAEAQPEFGPAIAANFRLAANLDRRQVRDAVSRREALYRRLRNFLGPRDLLCLPTTPTPAPLKGSGASNRTGDYYRRALALTSIAGMCRVPQISMPVASVDGAPIGLSLIAAFGEDMFLLNIARAVAEPF